MKRKKGFTLIELLAVIVILAVIALIATPIIMNIIRDAQKGAFQDSAYGIMHAAELYYTQNQKEATTPVAKTFTFPDDKELNFKGERPIDGNVIVDEKGNIALAISNGTWCAKKEQDSTKIIMSKYVKDDCRIIEETPASYFTFVDGTITKYENSEPIDLVIPKQINGQLVTAIGKEAFVYHHLKSITIPGTVKNIEDYAFSNCQTKKLTLSEGITAIGEGAFQNNYLTDVSIPDSVTVLKRNAFSNNDIKKVNIPPNITTIEYGVFYANELTNVKIPETVTIIEGNAFAHNKITDINIPKTVTSLGIGVLNNNQLPDDKAFIYSRNSDGTNNTTELISYGGAKREGVVIPNTVVNIVEYALWRTEVKSLSISDSVRLIGDYALANNGMTSVNMSNQITRIGRGAFSQNKLTEIIIPSTVTEIDTMAFQKNIFNDSNIGLSKIINKTGKSFDWTMLLTGKRGTSAVTGTWEGVEITAE